MSFRNYIQLTAVVCHNLIFYFIPILYLKVYIYLKILTSLSNILLMCLKITGCLANSVDPDQTIF